MNDIEEVMFSRIIEHDERQKYLYSKPSSSWYWFKILLVGFIAIIVLALLGI